MELWEHVHVFGMLGAACASLLEHARSRDTSVVMMEFLVGVNLGLGFSVRFWFEKLFLTVLFISTVASFFTPTFGSDGLVYFHHP